MTDHPEGVNLKFSSFAKKEGYKPPSTAQLLQKKDQKRQRFAPGGDWGDDSNDQPAQQLAPTIKPTAKTVAEHMDDLIDINVKEDNTTSKFKFIKKPNKAEKTSTMDKTDNEQVLLDFDSIRSER